MSLMRPLRSVLYIPASKPRALDKAKTLPIDAIIFDLEDAVSQDEKIAARATLAEALSTGGYGQRLKIVRVNGHDTQWGKDDVKAAVEMKPDALLIPKVSSPSDLDVVAKLAPDVPLWAMMETPQGMLNAAAIATHPALEGMVMGTNDLAKELQTRFRPDRLPLVTGFGAVPVGRKSRRIGHCRWRVQRV